MPDCPKVSVIIPVYNAAEFLPDCLDSVLAQTLREIEVICIDDGSSDESLSVLRAYADREPRLRVESQENAGAGAARNAGIALARGEYLSFLDADDFFSPHMLERAYAVSRENDADVGIFRCDLYDNASGRFLKCPWSVKKRDLPAKNPFCYTDLPERIFNFSNGWAWDKLFRRKMVIDGGMTFQRLRTTNDMFFVFSSYVRARRIVFIDEVFVHQRVNVGSSLTATREKSWDCFYLALKALKDELIRLGVYSTVERSFVNWALELCLWNVNTLRGESLAALYDLLRGEGFALFDIDKHPRDYFYNRNEYDQYRAILETPFAQRREKPVLARYAGKFFDTCRNEGFYSAYCRMRSKLLGGKK